MNLEDPIDADLKARFTDLRKAETSGAPSFTRTLAAARAREARPRATSSLRWKIGALSAAADQSAPLSAAMMPAATSWITTSAR